MVSSRTGFVYKHIGTEGSTVCDTFILSIQKGLSSPCANRQSSSIKLVRGKKPTHDSRGKGYMAILFNQSDYTSQIAQYLSKTLNTMADMASRERKNLSSKWIC